jgi:menaquinone-specific isochorismate synthase
LHFIKNIERSSSDVPEHKSIQAIGFCLLQVPLPPGIKPLQWLQSQARNSSVLFPCSYFSPRAPRGDGEGATIVSEDGFNVNDIDACSFLAVAGVGSTVTFSDDKPFSKKSWQATQRFLSKGSPSIRMYGGMRFDPDGMPAAEWRPFGSFYFFVPQLELCECHGCSLLAVNIAWDKALNWSFQASICKALLVLSKVTGGVSWSASHERRTSVVESKQHSPDEGAWTHAVRSVLEMIKDSSHGSPPVVSSRYLPNGSVSETKPSLSKVLCLIITGQRNISKTHIFVFGLVVLSWVATYSRAEHEC